MIRANGISKIFGDVTALDGVDFKALPGEIVGVVGPGGAGKSVLLKTMCGLVVPDSGYVEAMGQRLDKLQGIALAKLRENYGVLFQNNALFDFMTVFDNVAFPLRQKGNIAEADISERVSTRLAAVGLGRAAAQLPGELSGGMKKRASLARATIAGAEILLYDDPTAGLDPVTSSKIFRLIAELAGPKVASVVVSHDVDRMKPVCTRYVLIDAGSVRFEGTWSQAERSDDPMVRTFFGARTPLGRPS